MTILQLQRASGKDRARKKGLVFVQPAEKGIRRRALKGGNGDRHWARGGTKIRTEEVRRNLGYRKGGSVNRMILGESAMD